ncbi:alpha/beta hydrolase [Mycolicibacterium brumae]|uniref:Alpha/beta hydrolase n=1 Tax=Mycolicibacterium brumae TaxID=85968 RepID=A0A2G5P3Q6_9MYCO|nr:alpha/beta hydrolase [Mycolicibacterium brumae]PIB73078.1 alpha/beta hydrolase [Mycolicibacterium brumae]RWA16951.1 hypothetical protein MBRU_19000 [Mycolicibacterium brumae DSM 44177]UWW07415.1 alpha/beta hydrolase [Mycolicibacterium brumae]
MPQHPEILAADLLADALADVVCDLALPPVTLIGNSVGGFAAARLAITDPGRVDKLILVQAGGFTPLNAAIRGFSRAMGTPTVLRTVFPTNRGRLYEGSE